MKTKAILAAAVMMICAFAAVCYTDASDAALSPDEPDMNFYVYVGGTWVSYTGDGYNAAQALADTNIPFTWASEIVNGTSVTGADYTYTYTSYGYTATSINPYYGELATVNGISDFTVYYFDGANWISNSVIGLKSIGFYKPYNDYTLKTANIAFVPNGESPNTLPTTGLQPISVVPSTDDYKVTFHVGNTTYYGYGSDAATAFKNAMDNAPVQCTIDLSMVTTIDAVQYLNLNYYGHVSRIANQTQLDAVVAEYDEFEDVTYVTGDYDYWALSLSDHSPSNFMLGFYSPLSYAPLIEDEFYLDFTHDHFEWTEEGDTTWKYNNN